LTEEEKRSNHIASEQKRRSTIRTGFKDLTDIVPTLKNLNNSKSTVLFKAVDYIKYLEKRNKSLREKMESLEVRIKVEGQISGMGIHSASLQQPMEHSNRPAAPRVNHSDDDDDGVTAAIRAHRSQQNQLLAIQEQLQYQQRMLTRDDDHAHHSLHSSSSSNSSSPSDLYPPRWNYDGNDKSVKMEVDHEDRLKLAA
jgi:hypothetical protein